MKEHFLKTLPEFFAAVADGSKTFEVRRDDRGFEVGDTLILQEFDPSKAVLGLPREKHTYTGREIRRRVIYKLDGGQFGIEAGFCVLGLAEVSA